MLNNNINIDLFINYIKWLECNGENFSKHSSLGVYQGNLRLRNGHNVAIHEVTVCSEGGVDTLV